MRRTLTAATVLAVALTLGACSSSGPTTLEKDALAVTRAAGTHDLGVTTVAVRRLRADLAAARRSGSIDATRAMAIESAAQQVLADLRGTAPAPAHTTSPPTTVVTPTGGDTKSKDKQGNGNGDGGNGGGD